MEDGTIREVIVPEALKGNELGISEFKELNEIPDIKTNFVNAWEKTVETETVETTETTTEVTTETTTEPVLEWYKKLGYEKDEDAVNEITTLKTLKPEHDKLKSDFELTKKEKEDLAQKLSDLDYADENFFKLNALSKKLGNKDISTLSKIIDCDKVDDLDVLILKRVLDNPKKAERIDTLKEALIEKYDLARPDDYKDLEPEEQAKIDAKIKRKYELLNDDAEGVRAEFRKLTEGIKSPEKQTKEQTEAIIKEKAEALAPFVDKALVDTKLKIKVSETETVDVDVSGMNKYKDVLTMMLLQNTDMSDAGISKVFNNFMNHVVVPDNQLNISKAIVAREEQKWKKYIEDTYINPTKPDHDKNIKKPEDKSTQLTDEQMGLGKQKFL